MFEQCSSFFYDEKVGVCYRLLAFLDFPNYCVGDDGSVWSKGKQWISGLVWKKRKPFRDKNGYLLVDLYNGSKWRKISVHRLVLEAFAGPRLQGMVCRHFPDRSPTNNRLENIRLGTVRQNAEDMKIHGTLAQGERGGRAKLSDEQVLEIRRLWPVKSTCKLGKLFGVSRHHISSIVHYKSRVFNGAGKRL